jgi:hypothetical protein
MNSHNRRKNRSTETARVLRAPSIGFTGGDSERCASLMLISMFLGISGADSHAVRFTVARCAS